MDPKRLEVVFRTGRPHEILMALNELQAAGVPVFPQEEAASGLVTAMPATPVGGPGTSWAIKVPAQAVQDARQVLEGLPMDAGTSPDVWHYGPRPGVRKWWRWWVILVLIGIAIGMIQEIHGLLGN